MGFLDAFKEEYRARPVPPPKPEPPFVRREDRCQCGDGVAETHHGREIARYQAEIERLRQQNGILSNRLEGVEGELRNENFGLLNSLREKERQLAESQSLIRDLAAEVQKLDNELKVRRRAEPRAAQSEQYKQLKRLVLKHVHPDCAPNDKRLRTVLESICKEVNAGIERIEAP